MELIIENVRSFRGKHTIPIRALTLIVGENSTGKTTFLSMLAAVCNEKFPSHSLFNRPPYDLGTFDTIASHPGGRWRSNSFTIGFSEKVKNGIRTAEATFEDSQGQPNLKKFTANSPRGHIELNFNEKLINGRITIQKNNEPNIDIHFEDKDSYYSIEGLAIHTILPSIFKSIREKDPKILDFEEKGFHEFYETLDSLLSKPNKSAVSIAPVRTKPHRTYDELQDDFNPEGNHIPLILSRIWSGDSVPKREKLKNALQQFGKDSGLFSDLEVKKLGRSPSDPFQIKIKSKGPSRNLTDVGYGVSQSLPVIVESVLCSTSSMMLLQQPEVHLHPRAQAALGTFLCDLAANQKKSFVVETHSDYLLDRIRQEVANKKIKPEDVLILFFDKSKTDTTVHRIEVDKEGNIKNAPSEYRSFFLQEEMNLLLRGR